MTWRALLIVWLSSCFQNLLAAEGQNLTIRGKYIQATYEGASGDIQLSTRPGGRTFLAQSHLVGSARNARVIEVVDLTFGKGRAIERTQLDGSSDMVIVFPKLPFALFRYTLRNASDETRVFQKIRTLSAMVKLDAPADQLKTLGTGGLLPPEKNPGSYMWLSVADPRTRAGVVLGWLTSARGSGVLFTSVEGAKVQATAQIDYGQLRVAPRSTEELETLAVGFFEDARLGLEEWADAVAKVRDIHLPTQPSGYCTWYSNPHGGASDEKHLAEQSVFASETLKPFGFSVVQIDDGWQAGVSTNGPKRNFTEHRASGPYPSGMKSAADQIKALGLVPGIWFMPFAGTYYDPFFADHPDWFVKCADGRPYETDWGGTCLDLTHPGPREHVRSEVRRIAEEWGYQYFKMDGLWTGTATKQQYVNSGYQDDGMGDAVFHNPNKTNIEAYRDGLKLIRETVGRKVFILGCCSPQNMRSYGAAFGLVDAMRIGPDNGSDWEGLLRGPTFGSRQYFLNGRVWYNDPDPVYVRNDIPLQQAQLICSWVALSGQLNLSSEWLPGLSPERLDLLKRTMPNHGLLPRPVDLFDHELPSVWVLSDSRRKTARQVIGLFNWDRQDQTFDYELKRLGLDASTGYSAFDYWHNAILPDIQGHLRSTLPPQSCRILSLAPRLHSQQPRVVSTSRHITQGVVDLLEEKWDPGKRTLSGVSKVVAGDRYELRIATERAPSSFQVSSGDGSPETKISLHQEEGLVRATIEPTSTQDVRWVIGFK